MFLKSLMSKSHLVFLGEKNLSKKLLLCEKVPLLIALIGIHIV
jgi:hypothetical protein